jgi:hypothetical protein
VRGLGVVAVVCAGLAVAPFASATQNACVLVKPADVSTALTGKVGAGDHLKAGGFNTCVYKLRKVTVTVKTRALSHAGFAQAIKKIPGTALKATDISSEAWVYFVANGSGVDDWKRGNEIGIVVTGAGADAVLILKSLAKTARAAV